ARPRFAPEAPGRLSRSASPELTERFDALLWHNRAMKIFQVGGAVRDKLLGIPSADVDHVVVGATAQQMLDLGYRTVGKDFPVFLHPQTHEEYALARTERKTAPGYHGFAFDAAPTVSLEDDLLRRDLTINAIAEDADGR